MKTPAKKVVVKPPYNVKLAHTAQVLGALVVVNLILRWLGIN